MTAKLWACLSIFQEANHIEKTLQAANSWAEGFIVLDGAYRTFPHAGDGSSTDGTLELVERFKESTANGRAFIVESHLWENQIKKRNRYLELVPTDDWVMIVDGDFQIVFYGNGYDEYKENLVTREWDGFQCRVIMQGSDRALDLHWGNPLLFRKVLGLHYKYNHYSLYDDAECLLVPPLYRWKEIELVVLEAIRTIPHFKAIRSYQLSLQAEQSNGQEPLWCDDCKLHIKLREGEPLLCPKCGHGGLSNPPFPELEEFGRSLPKKGELLAPEQPSS